MHLPEITTLYESAMAEARKRWNAIAKPLGSLGQFEDLIVQIAGIQGTSYVTIDPRCVYVFCADHGVVCHGVTQTGSSVSLSVAQSMAEGHSNINLMAGLAHATVCTVDIGLKTHPKLKGLIDVPVGDGTADFTSQAAMTIQQTEQAIQIGINLAVEGQQNRNRLLIAGEMGIGNTTSSTAIACALLQKDPHELVGRGAGLSDEGLRRKEQVIQDGLALHAAHLADPLEVLSRLGGFEIAGMVGLMLGAASCHVPVIIDGAIAAVAALLAVRLRPSARLYLLPSHMSRAPLMQSVMEALKMQPPIHAQMGLGEGTGAVMLLPLLDMALSVYHGPHTFQSLHMPAYTEKGGAR